VAFNVFGGGNRGGLGVSILPWDGRSSIYGRLRCAAPRRFHVAAAEGPAHRAGSALLAGGAVQGLHAEDEDQPQHLRREQRQVGACSGDLDHRRQARLEEGHKADFRGERSASQLLGGCRQAGFPRLRAGCLDCCPVGHQSQCVPCRVVRDGGAGLWGTRKPSRAFDPCLDRI
jgi:hypothetical protein